MRTNGSYLLILTLMFGALFLGSCGKPRVEKKLPPSPDSALYTPSSSTKTEHVRISITYPDPNMPRPNVDSNFIFGNVGVYPAHLTINGAPVAVAGSSGFLAFLLNPQVEYLLIAEANGESDTLRYRYAEPSPIATEPTTPPVTNTFPAGTFAVVITGRDTFQTGSDVVPAAPTPSADRKWCFPKGTLLTPISQTGNSLRVRLGGVEAYLQDTSVILYPPGAKETHGLVRVDLSGIDQSISAAKIETADRYDDIVLPVHNAPFLIEESTYGATITIYDRQSATSILPSSSGFITGGTWQNNQGNAVLSVGLSKYLWGFKAFYKSSGELVVRLRKPPVIDKEDPLRGLKIVIDAGHPPGGAKGPTGLTEPEANLAIALRLAEMLRAHGAEVIMTRTTPNGLVSSTNQAAELWARVDLAVWSDADLLLSIHNNAFPDGVNPFLNYGTSTYYYQANSQRLAEALLRRLLPVTAIPNMGAKYRSLALVRPTWMPTSLTESMYMMFPEQEARLRDPDFLHNLAAGHLHGLVDFLSSVSEANPTGQ